MAKYRLLLDCITRLWKDLRFFWNSKGLQTNPRSMFNKSLLFSLLCRRNNWDIYVLSAYNMSYLICEIVIAWRYLMEISLLVNISDMSRRRKKQTQIRQLLTWVYKWMQIIAQIIWSWKRVWVHIETFVCRLCIFANLSTVWDIIQRDLFWEYWCPFPRRKICDAFAFNFSSITVSIEKLKRSLKNFTSC